MDWNFFFELIGVCVIAAICMLIPILVGDALGIPPILSHITGWLLTAAFLHFILNRKD